MPLPFVPMRAAATFAILSITAWAQQHPVPPPADPISPNLQVQKIGPNDLIALSIYDAPELSRTYRVGANGLLHLPMLKARIAADGLLPAELEDKIAEALDQ